MNRLFDVETLDIEVTEVLKDDKDEIENYKYNIPNGIVIRDNLHLNRKENVKAKMHKTRFIIDIKDKENFFQQS